jgi:hypothetical protein
MVYIFCTGGGKNNTTNRALNIDMPPSFWDNKCMPKINLNGMDTQSAPMAAIAEIITDCYNGHVSPKMAIDYINAVCCEWSQ